MQPSSDQSGSAAPGGGALRRWGPIAAIVVVLAVVGALVVFSGDDDEPETTDSAATDDGAGDGGAGDGGDGGEAPEGAVTYAMAEAAGTVGDYTWMDSCDTETGLVSMPNQFAGECYANVEDNGGATYAGVTEDEIKVVVYQAPEDDPVLSFITAPIANDDTNPQEAETLQGYTDMFNAIYQTYGRKVVLEFMTGSGTSTDEVAARADAVKAMEELGAFAVWGGPVLSNAWTEEIKARGGVCIGCPGLRDAAPSVFGIVPSAQQTRQAWIDWVGQKLAGKPAEYAGDESMHGTERVFGQLYIDTGSADVQEGLDEQDELVAEAGFEITERVGYELNPGTLAEQASTAIARLQEAGVTSVIIGGDPIAPKTFTEVATQQGFFPEWILNGAALQDTSAFGRTYDQQQWAHAFGISALAARTVNGLGDAERVYQWWAGEYPPADDTVGVLWPLPAVFFSGVQAAGPNLTMESFRDGLFSIPPNEANPTQQGYSYGEHGIWPQVDYGGIDDFAEVWWDPTVEGDDEIRKPGTGMYQSVDGGRRYRLGEWPDELRFFDLEGAVAIYEELPPEWAPAAPPPPPGSPAAGG
ncbi:MAG: hypothetical protein ACLGI8_11805 [Acidimicrobiia bacterium]